MIAQQPQQTRDGIITTFAPVVEKVAPSVVTVSTTQTVSRGLTAYPFSDDALRQFSGDALRKDKANRAARPRLRCNRNKQPVKSAKDLLTISKKLKPNEKILMRVYSQGRSGYVALEANK